MPEAGKRIFKSHKIIVVLSVIQTMHMHTWHLGRMHGVYKSEL